MPKSCIVDTSALVALLDPREEHHQWARELLVRQPAPWFTCEAVISESFYMLHEPQFRTLESLLLRGQVRIGLNLAQELNSVLALRVRYASVPMSVADAGLVRLSEILPEPIVLTTDRDFHIYRRHGRQVIPCLLP